MLMTLTVIASAIVAALAFRLRGDSLFNIWTGTGTTGGRAMFATVMMALAIVTSWAVSGPADWWLLILGPAFFLGCIAGWPTGTESGMAAWWRVSGRGILWVLPAVLTLATLDQVRYAPAWGVLVDGRGWWWLLVAGAVCPAALAAGRWVPQGWQFVEPGHEAGEFLFGGVLGVGLAVALLA